MKDKITIIKIGDNNYYPTPEDLERWRGIFAGEVSEEEMLEKYPHMKSQPVEKCYLDADPDYDRVVLVKVGDKGFTPTPEDLEHWRKVFTEAAADKDFKIFTHSRVNVEELRLDKSGNIIVE